jgi:hypothetical protein
MSMNEADLTIETLIEGDGYTLLEGVIDSDSAAGIRERMLARLDEGHPASDGVVRMGNILDWGSQFEALVSHGLLWHRTRVAVLINYTQLTVRPMAPWGPFTDEFNDAASPALRTLLAFDYGESLRRRLPTANGK